MKRLTSLCLAVLLPALLAGSGEALPATFTALPTGEISLFRGLAGGVGSIEIYDEDGVVAVQRPPLLQGIVLLPVDFVGRTRIGELDPARPRYRNDVAGASRVELPGGAGSIYHYRRDDTNGGPSDFGFFLIDANGTAAVLHELAGSGVGGATDPFLPKLAVSADGLSLLVATTVAAGGDLLSIDLGSGAVVDHTSSLAAQAFTTNGLALGVGFGLGVTTDEVLLFDSTIQGQAASVAFPGGTPAYLQGDVALSGDGTCAALIAGATQQAAHVWCLTAGSAPLRVSQTPRTMTGGGFLPESFGGPHLALSTDGSTCIWSSEELLARETWSREVSPLAQGEEQITSDQRFVDTLDTSGGILPYQANSFLLTVGETDLATGGVENGDVYSVVLDSATGVTTVTNLSGTSGDALTPFSGGGTISDAEGTWWLPSTQQLLVLADENLSGGTLSLMGISAQAGSVQFLIANVRSIDVIESVAGQVVLGMTKRVNSVDSTEIFTVPLDLSSAPTRIGFAATDLDLSRSVPRDTGQVTFIATAFPDEYLVRLDVNLGSFEVFFPVPLTYGAGLDLTPKGSVALSLGVPDVAMGFGTWPLIGAPTLLPAGLQPGQVLPH